MMKIKKNRKLHGSVLLTVVVVMSLLIVFLFGTLTLATAANNRAHVNYSSAQTNVTSRTVVDAAVKAMTQDPDYAKFVTTNASFSNLYVPVQLSAVHEGRYGDIVDDNGNSNVVVTHAGTKKFYDADKQEWVDADVFKFTATVRLGGVDSTTSAYVVNPPTPLNPDKGGGGFSTASGANISCQSNIFGGSYLNMPKKDVSELFNYTYRTDYSDKSDATNYRQFAESDVFHLQNSGGSIRNDVFVYNNMSVENWSKFIFGKGEGLTVWGNLEFGSNVYTQLNYETTTDYANIGGIWKELINVDRDVNGDGEVNGLDKAYEGDLNFTDIPYIYVDGTIKGSSIKLGDTTNKSPLNVFCGNINYSGTSNQFVVSADIYCMNENETSIINATGNVTSLYSWTGSVINRSVSSEPQEHSKGSINTKGSLELQGIKFDGDVHVEKDCTIKFADNRNNLPEIDGDLYVGGNLVIPDKEYLTEDHITGTIYCNPNNVYIGSVAPENKLKMEDENIEYKVPNDSRQYFKYTPDLNDTNGDESPSYKDAFGEYTLSSNEPVYYRWNFEYDTKSGTYGSFETINESLIKSLDTDEVKKILQKEEGWPKKVDELPITEDGRNDIYYVITNPNRANVSKEDIGEDGILILENPHGWNSMRNSKYNIIDIDQMFNKVGWSRPAEIDDSGKTAKYTIKSLTIEAQYSGSKVQPLEADTVIYPVYAEKYTILGLDSDLQEKEGFDSDNRPEGQIVKTVEDISAGVFDIYANKLPTNMSDKYNEIKDNASKIYTSKQDILTGTGKIVTDFDANKVVDGKKQVTYTAVDYDGTLNSNIVYINKDCVLNTGIANGDANTIIFNPGTTDMLVVIRGDIYIGDGIKVYVDDSLGGNVYFYIEKDSSFNFSGNNVLFTTSYTNLFNNYENAELKYNCYSSPGTELKDTDELTENTISPNTYIYGDENSKLSFGNGGCATAYILSPDLSVTWSAGGKLDKPKDFYYEDSKLPDISGHPFLFGALNAKDATMPNDFNFVYIPEDAGGSSSSDPAGGASGGYSIMYYDEY